MFTEDQLLPISALQHLIFCERQCALIHVERLWAENRWTVEGNHLHKKAHGELGDLGKTRHENGIRVARGLQLRSLTLGLIGQADVVEFHRAEPDNQPAFVNDCRQRDPRRSRTGETVIPVEYKRGKPKKDDSDRVQICAQGLCLEEMLHITIDVGFLFYGKRKRRTEVNFDQSLRERTITAIQRLRKMLDNRETPPAIRAPKCDSCSLIDLCLPDAMRLKKGASWFVDRELTASLSSDGPTTDELGDG